MHSALGARGGDDRRSTHAEVATYDARHKFAVAALEVARKRPNFIANYCFSPHGTAYVAATVEGWHVDAPRNHTISDDIENMYQCVNRSASFAFVRKRCPRLLGISRFFYGDSE